MEELYSGARNKLTDSLKVSMHSSIIEQCEKISIKVNVNKSCELKLPFALLAGVSMFCCDAL